jgi:hypothetical protein
MGVGMGKPPTLLGSETDNSQNIIVKDYEICQQEGIPSLPPPPQTTTTTTTTTTIFHKMIMTGVSKWTILEGDYIVMFSCRTNQAVTLVYYNWYNFLG